ncbi:urease accessory UreF family protein [Pararhodobacter marinus]|uniref:urease accessory UreF family protein n=1 Tax=Pararhodobacter marinus TaxID=2184063 RepID=UPI003516F612
MTDTPNAADLLCVTQWLSPAFPTGAFAYSHGLERVIATGTIRDAATLEDWLTGILLHGAGWQDAVLLAQGLRAGTDLDALDALARALAPSAERLKETLDQGAALSRTIAGMDASGGKATGPDRHAADGATPEGPVAPLGASAGGLPSDTGALGFMASGQRDGMAHGRGTAMTSTEGAAAAASAPAVTSAFDRATTGPDPAIPSAMAPGAGQDAPRAFSGTGKPGGDGGAVRKNASPGAGEVPDNGRVASSPPRSGEDAPWVSSTPDPAGGARAGAAGVPLSSVARTAATRVTASATMISASAETVSDTARGLVPVDREAPGPGQSGAQSGSEDHPAGPGGNRKDDGAGTLRGAPDAQDRSVTLPPAGPDTAATDRSNPETTDPRSPQAGRTAQPARHPGALRTSRTLPIALAEAARRTALPPATIIALFLQGFAGNLVTIAVRHVPLGQTEGQTVLARLAPVIVALAAQAAEASLEDLGGSALAGDLAAFEHETQDVRIFRT